jgi:uncharacterized membrane protein
MALSIPAAAGGNLGEGERLASTLGGALLLFYGLARRPSLMSAVLAAAGGLLLQRGVTGHCLIYRALGFGTHPAAAADRADREDEVARAVEDSFPASDPPSWSPHTAGSPAG